MEAMMSRLTRRGVVRGAIGLGLAIGATSLLAACGGGAASPAQAPAAAPTAAAPPAVAATQAQAPAVAATTAPKAAVPSGTTEIEIGSYFDSGPRLDFVNKVLDKFKQDNPGVQVKFEPVPGAQYWDKMQVRLASNTAPDILIGSGSTFLNFAEKGAWGEVDG